MIEYPDFKFSFSLPTPNDFLVVCDHCNSARWTIRIHGPRHQYYCTRKHREREATPTEYAEAREKLLAYKVGIS